MISFTEEIKNEITSSCPHERACKTAMLSAFIRTSGSIISRNGFSGFEFVTENERTAEFFTEMLEGSFGITPAVTGATSVLMSGKDKLAYACADERTEALLQELGIVGTDKGGKFIRFGIDDKLVSRERRKISYIKGAFLGGGSCTVPEESTYSRTGYHFEIVFSNKLTARHFCELLCQFEVLAKLVTRKESAVVYVKSKEVISDILNLMSCPLSLEKLNKIVEQKDRQNNANRVNNCSVSNIDKTLTASVNQVRAIEIIAQTIGLQSLDKQLFDVAACRLADKNASMQELAARLDITKSCINHRMRKILELAQSLGKD